MAREMALAGVSKEELQPDLRPEEPQTPKEKFQNFWYYYKWWVFAAIALLVIIFIGVYQMVTTVKPDYMLTLVTKASIESESIKGMEEELAKYGDDLNGDGKIVVDVENLPLAQYVGGTKSPAAEMNSQKLMAYMVSADSMFFAFDADCYSEYLEKLTDSSGTAVFFDELSVKGVGYDEENHYWNWSQSDYSASYWGVDMPKDLYFGVRIMGGSASGEKVQTRHDTCSLLLEQFIENQSSSNGNVKNTTKGNRKTYSEMKDGTWMCDGVSYKYRLEISGKLHNAAKEQTYVYLSNLPSITFEQAWKASGLSSDTSDYFDSEEAVLVELR